MLRLWSTIPRAPGFNVQSRVYTPKIAFSCQIYENEGLYKRLIPSDSVG